MFYKCFYTLCSATQDLPSSPSSQIHISCVLHSMERAFTEIICVISVCSNFSTLHTHFDNSLKLHKAEAESLQAPFMEKPEEYYKFLIFQACFLFLQAMFFQLSYTLLVDSFNHPSTIQWFTFLLFWCVSTTVVVIIPSCF